MHVKHCKMSDFNKLCRACLNAIDTFKYNLFEHVSADVYWFCTNIEVIKDENLPRSICNTCYNLITKFSEFKKTCLESHNILLNYYDSLAENKKLDFPKNEPATDPETETKGSVLIKVEEQYGCTVKVEDSVPNYDDFDQTDSLNELHVEIEIETNKSHKNVRLKAAKGRENLKCELCSKNFVSHKRLELHKLAHEKERAVKCKSCNKTFATWKGLQRHNASWHARVPFSAVTCGTCGKIARTRDTLRAHERHAHGHARSSQFICNVCGRVCTTASVLKAHLETHKENRERVCTCEHCGKKFYTNKILLSHVKRCHTGKRYICQICNYPFTDKYNLTKHLLNHDGKGRAFKCEICNKSFTSRFSYKEHQRTHSGERPYVCEYCTKSFISKRRLTEHHRTHTGEKPHKCSLCDHSFSQRGTLTRHMKVHEKMDPAVS